MHQPDLYSVLAGKVGQTVVFRGGSSAPVKLASIHRAGASIILHGRGLDGAPVRRSVQARGGMPLLAGWQVRLASMLRLAAALNWDETVKDLIRHAGLPVDPKINWTNVIHSMFNDANLATKDPEYRDELIQHALYTIVMRRSLEKFDPNAIKDPRLVNDPLEKKVNVYMIQLLGWALGAKESVQNLIHKDRNPDTFSGDAVGGEDGDLALWDALPGDAARPDQVADGADDVHNLADFRSTFETYVRKRRRPPLPDRIMFLFDLITNSANGEHVVQDWNAHFPPAPGTNPRSSEQIMRKVLRALHDEMVAFAQSVQAPNTDLTRMVNDLQLDLSATAQAADLPSGPASAEHMLVPPEPPAPEPVDVGVGPKAHAMRSSSMPDDGFKLDVAKTAAFMRALQNEVVRLACEGSIYTMRVAKPKVVDSSVLFVVLEGNQLNYLNMNIRFGGPSISKNPGAGTEYTLDVGMYGPDRSLPEGKIKKQLNALVFPSMRSDVPENFHNLLEKVIRELRGIIWENAVEFFEVPQEERATWRHVIRMNVLTLQDVKVSIAEDGVPVSMTSSEAPKESTPMTAASRFAKLKKAAEENPEEVSTKVEAIKQTLLDQVTLLENFQQQLDMSPEGAEKFEAPEEGASVPEKFAGLKRAAEEEPAEIEDAVQVIFLGLDEAMAQVEALADDLGVQVVAPAEGSEGGAIEEEAEEEGTIEPPAEVVEVVGTPD